MSIQCSYINNNIDWWYKNGDCGKDYFSVPYDNNRYLFYPDWFIRLKNGKILIVDTKGGITAKDSNTKPKVEALHKYLKDNKLDSNYIVGIVVKNSDIWKINTNTTYICDDSYEQFEDLNNILNKST